MKIPLSVSRLSHLRVLSDTKGFTLMEVLVALSIMSSVAVAFVASMGMTMNTSTINQDKIVAENLAKSQMEYVKGQIYNDTDNPPVYPKITATTGYYIDPVYVRLNPLATTDDEGIQRIEVRIYKGTDASGSLLFELIGYKVK